jgi:hypothetical protein
MNLPCHIEVLLEGLASRTRRISFREGAGEVHDSITSCSRKWRSRVFWESLCGSVVRRRIRAREHPQRLPSWCAVAAIVVFLAFIAPTDADEVRTWTAGKITKQAVFVRLDGEIVTLRLVDGGEVEVPLARLSEADRLFIASQEPSTRAVAAEADPFRRKQGDMVGGSGSPGSLSGSTAIQAVRADGVGLDKKSAEEDAWRSAVRMVVGGYVDSETVIENDQLIRDTIITLSSAYVEKARTLKTRNEDGLIRVTVEADVRVTKLLDTLASHSISIIDVDSSMRSSRDAKDLTQQEQSHASDELFVRALRNYPEGCLKVSAAVSPITAENVMTYRVTVEPDMEAFGAVADKICEALGAIGHPSGLLRGDSFNFGVFEDRLVSEQEFASSHGASVQKAIESLFPVLSQIARADGSTSVEVAALRSALVTFNWGAGAIDDKRFIGVTREHPHPHYRVSGTRQLVILPYRSTPSLSRVVWRWFELPRADLVRLLKEVPPHGIEIAAECLTKEGNLVTDDITLLRGIGWIRPGSVLDDGPVVISPFPLSGYLSLQAFVPSFSFGRVIKLAPSELEAVSKLKVSVRAGS